MTTDEARTALIALWLEKADSAISSAEVLLRAGEANSAVNRLYYACFYGVTALLLKDGRQFARHSSVKAEFNRAYVNAGRVEAQWGNFYQNLFRDRQEADYVATVKFEVADIFGRLEHAREFVRIIRALIYP
jgi:hypothetical protein